MCKVCGKAVTKSVEKVDLEWIDYLINKVRSVFKHFTSLLFHIDYVYYLALIKDLVGSMPNIHSVNNNLVLNKGVLLL